MRFWHCFIASLLAKTVKQETFRMTKGRIVSTVALATLAALACLIPRADAASCGSGPGGFEVWTQQFAAEARAKGISDTTIQALAATNYASATIAADRGQRSFSLSLDAF